jgi:hypothetical protein
MEKKSFLSGISAKIALSIVALSGALLTGCYQDDGLDVNGIKLPAATYTIAGQVVDAETFEAIPTATVSGDVSASVVNGAFSVAVDSPKTYTLEVKNVAGYENAQVNVDVKEVNAGQSAVYSTVIALQPKYNGLYTLNVVAADENGTVLTDATTVIREIGVTTAAENGKLEGGKTYVVIVSAEGYTTSQVTVELPKVKTNTTKGVYVILSKKATGTVKIFGEVKIGNKTFSAHKIELRSQDGKELLGIDEGYTYNFEVSESYFTVKTRAAVSKSATFQMTIVDNNGVELTFDKTYEITVSEDGSNQGSDSNNQASSDVIIKVATTDVTTDNVVIATETITSGVYNSEEGAVDVDIVYTPYTGSTIVDGYTSVLAAANVTADNSNFYDAIIEALNPTNETATEFKKASETTTGKVSIEALTILNSVKASHIATSVERTVSGISVDGKEFKNIESLKNVIDKAKSTITTAAGKATLEPNTTYVGHDHTHGHGGSNNAGGGISNAE